MDWRMDGEYTTSSEEPVPVWASSRWKDFSLSPVQTNPASTSARSLCFSHAALHWEVPGSIFLMSHSHGNAAVKAPQGSLFPRLSKPCSISLPPAPWLWPSTPNSLQLTIFFLAFGGPKLNTICKHDLKSACPGASCAARTHCWILSSLLPSRSSPQSCFHCSAPSLHSCTRSFAQS